MHVGAEPQLQQLPQQQVEIVQNAIAFAPERLQEYMSRRKPDSMMPYCNNNSNIHAFASNSSVIAISDHKLTSEIGRANVMSPVHAHVFLQVNGFNKEDAKGSSFNGVSKNAINPSSYNTPSAAHSTNVTVGMFGVYCLRDNISPQAIKVNQSLYYIFPTRQTADRTLVHGRALVEVIPLEPSDFAAALFYLSSIDGKVIDFDADEAKRVMEGMQMTVSGACQLFLKELETLKMHPSDWKLRRYIGKATSNAEKGAAINVMVNY